MLLLPLENMFCTFAFIIAAIQLFSSFGKLNGMELPAELLHEGVNGEKSIDYARRMAFPLATSDNGVEMPPNVPNNMELNAANGFGATVLEDNDELEYDLPTKTEMPKWLQMQLQPETQQHSKYLHSAMLPKHLIAAGKHHHDSRQVHNSVSSSAAASPLKRCSIEISSKIPGICQAMGSIGNACVSGDYIDVFNSECL